MFGNGIYFYGYDKKGCAMILDLRELKKAGKTQESFFFEYTPETSLSDIPSADVVSPIKVEGEIYLVGDHSAELCGEVVFKMRGECTRCLDDAERTFCAEFNEVAGEDDGYPVVNDKIDLGKIVDDTVIMNMPVKFLCKDDCKGICAGCGVNLNVAQCKCEK